MTVAVIGGGVIGLCAAWSLRQRGEDVTLLEARRIGDSVSAVNAGWVTPSLSTPLASPGMLRTGLKQFLSREGALVIRPQADTAWLKWLWDFRRAARPDTYRAGVAALLRFNADTLDLFDRLSASGVDYEMHQRGILALALDDKGLSWFRQLFDELGPLGFRGTIEHLSREEAVAREPAIGGGVTHAALATIDRHVEPGSLLAGLHEHLMRNGADIREGSAVTRLSRERGRWRLGTDDGGTFTADSVVVALGSQTNQLLSMVGVTLPIIGAKGYSLEVAGTGAAPEHALYLCEAKLGVSPYAHAVRVAGVFELPGRDDSVSQRRAAGLVQRTRSYLGGWNPDVATMTKVRAGLRPFTPDSLPYIGPVGDDGLYVAAGHGMLGVTLAPATGQALATMICDDVIPRSVLPFQVTR